MIWLYYEGVFLTSRIAKITQFQGGTQRESVYQDASYKIYCPLC